MGENLLLFEEGDRDRMVYPKGILGCDDSKVVLNFNHSASFKKAKIDWDKRKKRINWNNILIKMTVTDEKTARLFHELPFQNKIAFSSFQTSYESVKYLCEWNWNIDYSIKYIGYDFGGYVRDSVESRKAKDYDILKLLNGEKDFMRKKV